MGAAFLLEGFAGVGPVERMGHGRVVVGDELTNLGLEFEHRGEACATQAFSVEDAEEDLDLVEPRTMFGQVDEADAVVDVREKFSPRLHRFEDAANVFFPREPCTSHFWATHLTKLSEI